MLSSSYAYKKGVSSIEFIKWHKQRGNNKGRGGTAVPVPGIFGQADESDDEVVCCQVEESDDEVVCCQVEESDDESDKIFASIQPSGSMAEKKTTWLTQESVQQWGSSRNSEKNEPNSAKEYDDTESTTPSTVGWSSFSQPVCEKSGNVDFREETFQPEPEKASGNEKISGFNIPCRKRKSNDGLVVTKPRKRRSETIPSASLRRSARNAKNRNG